MADRSKAEDDARPLLQGVPTGGRRMAAVSVVWCGARCGGKTTLSKRRIVEILDNSVNCGENDLCFTSVT